MHQQYITCYLQLAPPNLCVEMQSLLVYPLVLRQEGSCSSAVDLIQSRLFIITGRLVFQSLAKIGKSFFVF